ncbi:metallophosphoesterase family protein [Methylovulum miyakonense]|uniref:metallophosphoesterase family protein n=1 Tax=Methylovulum miyakonense TaxID=645578 RepID=UPI00035E467C|nr:metallophosphoesterase family protein [Methylovulum miyakonense]
MWTVEIIGAVDGRSHYELPYITGLLATDLQALAVGTAFVGRPGTLIYTNASDVIKVRSDLELTASQARAWMWRTLQKERQLAVHHPFKTWLLITGQDATSLVASICPRLEPLHMALKSASERQRNLVLLTAVFELYLTVAKTAGEKLDEGLSNFAVSAEGQVYYLDDEYYAWDGFVAFSIMLGVFIRSFIWFDAAFIEELGRNLVRLLRGVFQDSECQHVIAGQLQSMFMPNEQKEHLLQRLIKVLQHPSDAKPTSTSTSLLSTAVAPKAAKRQASGRYLALLADIHANYPALTCVLDYLKAEHINEGIVLGDIVGYGPEPQACIERLQDCGFQAIKGNHDYGVATGDTAKGFSREAKMAIDWTIGQLSADYRQWLNDLPLSIQQEDWYAVHGAPMDPDYFYAYVYAMTYQDNLDYMQQNGMGLCFHGHSHIPGIFARRKYNDVQKTGQIISLAAYQQALVCPGSVGQPRNGHTDTQFAIYDKELRRVSFMQLPYDYQSVIAKMRQCHLPEAFALRMLHGR